MLIADFSADLRSRVPLRRPAVHAVTRPHRALAAWLMVGLAVLAIVPFARGDRLLGATLPFWLVVAPLINLAWIERARIARSAGTWLRRARREPRMARRQRVSRAAACSAERS